MTAALNSRRGSKVPSPSVKMSTSPPSLFLIDADISPDSRGRGRGTTNRHVVTFWNVHILPVSGCGWSPTDTVFIFQAQHAFPPFPLSSIATPLLRHPVIIPSPRWLWGRPVWNVIGVIPFSLIASVGEQRHASRRARRTPWNKSCTHFTLNALSSERTECTDECACFCFQIRVRLACDRLDLDC